jgi:hypothetical protein
MYQNVSMYTLEVSLYGFCHLVQLLDNQTAFDTSCHNLVNNNSSVEWNGLVGKTTPSVAVLTYLLHGAESFLRS